MTIIQLDKLVEELEKIEAILTLEKTDPTLLVSTLDKELILKKAIGLAKEVQKYVGCWKTVTPRKIQ